MAQPKTLQFRVRNVTDKGFREGCCHGLTLVAVTSSVVSSAEIRRKTGKSFRTSGKKIDARGFTRASNAKLVVDWPRTGPIWAAHDAL